LKKIGYVLGMYFPRKGMFKKLVTLQRLTHIQVDAADAASRAAAAATSAIQEAFQHGVRVRVDQRADHVRDNQ
jgi:hypothetical protein